MYIAALKCVYYTHLRAAIVTAIDWWARNVYGKIASHCIMLVALDYACSTLVHIGGPATCIHCSI